MAPDGPTFRLLVGLGNPGREYSITRHNIGFMVLDRLADAMGATFRADKKWQADVATAGGVWLLKPQTYMNLSGESVGALARFYQIDPARVLVVLDDMALPLGRLRFRERGSAGGHNGLQSILDHLGTQDVPRLRIGIGSADPGAAVGHVLGRFAVDERPLVGQSLDRAAEAVRFAQENDLPSAMNRFNPHTPASPL
ncbi:MAG: aminoacyl-tRNA hydrolase [Chthoniobacteraceae bacterium]